jgi:hypothetical protein
VTSRAVGRTLRAAWLEYQDIRDGIVFMHASTTRLGFENALAKLPAGPGGKSTRAAGNMSDMKIKVRTHKQSEKATFAAFIAQPSDSHAAQLQKWINSPAVSGADLVDDPVPRRIRSTGWSSVVTARAAACGATDRAITRTSRSPRRTSTASATIDRGG